MLHFVPDIILEEEIFVPRNIGLDCDTIGRLHYDYCEKFIMPALDGPANAAIIDLEQRTLDTENQVLVVDERLVERIKFIKEGEFDEKEGAPTLKLVGDVTPINKVEVVKHEKVDPINEYPLSAAELAKQVHERGGVKYNLIWDIIRVNKIKVNKEYASYNFRYKKHADEYLKTGRVAKGVPSIYKPEAVDYIIQLAKNEP